MPSPGQPRYALTAAAFMALLIVLAGLLWFRPYITRVERPIAGTPTPPAMLAVTQFQVLPGSQACMSTITMEPDMGFAEFDLWPAKRGPHGGPPVEVTLRASGYLARANVPGGYPGGSVALPVAAPHHTEIGSVCFFNRGHTAVLLNGTTEPRTVASRTGTTIAGRSVAGDIALTFLAAKSSSPLEDLGRTFEHASNLTDRLVPVWAIWILAVVCVLFVPIGIVAAFYLSLKAAEPSPAP